MTLADLNQMLNSDPPDEPSEIENLTEGNCLEPVQQLSKA